MADAKVFKLTEELNAEKVGRGIEVFLRNKKGMITEGVRTPEGFFLQAKEETVWKKIAGMDLATQVQIVQVDSMITVEIGAGKWVDKLGAGAIGMVLFAPLLATAAWGAVVQKKLPGDIFAFIENFIISGGKSAFVSMSVDKNNLNKTICPNCHTAVSEDVNFCPYCGEKLLMECPKCHKFVALGTKFCSECGSPMIIKKYCSNCNVEIAEGHKFCPECGNSVN